MMKRLTRKEALWPALWAGAAGLAYLLCFPSYDLPALSLLYFPLLLGTVYTLQSVRQGVALGFGISLLGTLGGYTWIASVAQNFGMMPAPVAYGLLCLYSLIATLQIPVFLGLAYRARPALDRLPVFWRPLAWSAAYVFLEYLARFVKIFPEHLGQTLLAYPAIAQSASLGGVSLLSFLPIFFGAALFFARLFGWRGLPALGLAVLLIAGVQVYGKRRLAFLSGEAHETLRVGIVQHNMEEVEKRAQRTGHAQALQLIIQQLTRTNAELASAEPKPELLLWPETAYPILFPTGGKPVSWVVQSYANEVRSNVAELGVPLLFGAIESDGTYDYNAAVLLGPDGKLRGSYRKNALLVFGEHMPLMDMIPALKTLNPQIGDFGRGPGPVPLNFAHAGHDVPLGVNICYEAVMPEYMRGLARNGARLFVNLTKDSWFGDTAEPWQHLQVTILRAVEHGLPLVRATNTGLSGLILPNGDARILSAPFREAHATLEVPVPLVPAPTVYTRFGDWFAWGCLALALGLGLLGLRKSV